MLSPDDDSLVVAYLRFHPLRNVSLCTASVALTDAMYAISRSCSPAQPHCWFKSKIVVSRFEFEVFDEFIFDKSKVLSASVETSLHPPCADRCPKTCLCDSHISFYVIPTSAFIFLISVDYVELTTHWHHENCHHQFYSLCLLSCASDHVMCIRPPSHAFHPELSDLTASRWQPELTCSSVSLSLHFYSYSAWH